MIIMMMVMFIDRCCCSTLKLNLKACRSLGMKLRRCASVCAHRDTSVLHVSVICRYATWNYSKAEEIYYGSYNICINLMHKLASSCQSLWPVLLPDIIIHQHNLKPLLSFDCRRDKDQGFKCMHAEKQLIDSNMIEKMVSTYFSSLFAM